MARALQAKLKEPQTDENKRGPRPQDLIRLYEIILQVHTRTHTRARTHTGPTCFPALPVVLLGPGKTKRLNLDRSVTLNTTFPNRHYKAAQSSYKVEYYLRLY